MYLSVQKNSKRPSLLDVHLKYEHLSEQYVDDGAQSKTATTVNPLFYRLRKLRRNLNKEHIISKGGNTLDCENIVSSWEDLKNTASRSSVNRPGGCGVWKN